MKRRLPETDSSLEALLAELTDAAYRVALRHGFKAPFLDVELGLWRALRQVLARELPAPSPYLPPHPAGEGRVRGPELCLSTGGESWQA